MKYTRSFVRCLERDQRPADTLDRGLTLGARTLGEELGAEAAVQVLEDRAKALLFASEIVVNDASRRMRARVSPA